MTDTGKAVIFLVGVVAVVIGSVIMSHRDAEDCVRQGGRTISTSSGGVGGRSTSICVTADGRIIR